MKIKITPKSRKYAKQAKVMEKLINSPRIKAQLKEAIDAEIAKLIMYDAPWGQKRPE